jgi:hypothetical protein
MVIFLKTGNELRLRLQPDVDYYTRCIETQEGKSIKEILFDLGIDPALVAFIYTKGKIQGLDYIPTEGEHITLQPPVSGG